MKWTKKTSFELRWDIATTYLNDGIVVFDIIVECDKITTLNPTTDPTKDPTRDSVNAPTNDPTIDPTSDPTINPNCYKINAKKL